MCGKEQSQPGQQGYNSEGVNTANVIRRRVTVREYFQEQFERQAQSAAALVKKKELCERNNLMNKDIDEVREALNHYPF